MASYIGTYNGWFIKTSAKLRRGQKVLITPLEDKLGGCLHAYADNHSDSVSEEDAPRQAAIARYLRHLEQNQDSEQ